MSTETSIPTPDKPFVSESPVAKTATSTPVADLIIATVVMIFLFVGAICISVVMFNKEVSERRASFENVLQFSAEELQGMSVVELGLYLKDVKGVGENAGIYSNSSGYDKEIVEREHNQINDLIKSKTDI